MNQIMNERMNEKNEWDKYQKKLKEMNENEKMNNGHERKKGRQDEINEVKWSEVRSEVKWMDERMNAWMNEWLNEWLNERMN
jgi:hypothetical protein